MGRKRIAKKDVLQHARDMERLALLHARTRKRIRALAKDEAEMRKIERRWGL